jgi:hypothetical protein
MHYGWEIVRAAPVARLVRCWLLACVPLVTRVFTHARAHSENCRPSHDGDAGMRKCTVGAIMAFAHTAEVIGQFNGEGKGEWLFLGLD